MLPGDHIGIIFNSYKVKCKLETYYELLRVEAIMTEVKPRLLWLQLEGSLNPNNNGGGL